MTDSLIIAGRQFRSRLIVGTGKYKSFQETARALEASGADMVTVAVRRVNLDRSKESLLDYIDPKKYFLLPNTAGCYTADDTIRTARLAREVGLSDWIKLEVIGDQATLYPDVQATLEATRVLAKEGFTVLAYTSDDIVFAKRLVDAGASAVMPLGAPIGSGLGIQNAANLRILRELITGVPLIVDAGVGTASDAAIAMELGYDAVLMNTGIAGAQEPVLMAEAMKHAVLAGRQAYHGGTNAAEALCDCQFAAGRRSAVERRGDTRSNPQKVCHPERSEGPAFSAARDSRSFASLRMTELTQAANLRDPALEHLDAVHVNLVAVDVSGHGNVMSVVILEGIGIVHRQDLLVLVGNDDRAGAGFDAFLGACFRARVGSLNATLGVADPAVHGLGIAGK